MKMQHSFIFRFQAVIKSILPFTSYCPWFWSDRKSNAASAAAKEEEEDFEVTMHTMQTSAVPTANKEVTTVFEWSEEIEKNQAEIKSEEKGSSNIP